ncbi:MAG TPA: phospho-N-acetylmuramoyl-pentapeptide-transferase [Pirellulales bacterium]|nr:phospho-N-acetylmuramoyl-pentapeptide-transferase [Pirellulales bacterium]
MLIWFLHHLAALGIPAWWSERIAAVDKSSPRALLASAASFTVALVMGPRLIAWLRCRFREPIVSDSPTLRQLHQAKHATPTMGGLFIVAGLLVGILVFADLTNRYVQVAALTAVGLAAVGVVDDLAKLRGRRNGLTIRGKLLGQTPIALAAAWLVYQQHARTTDGLLWNLPGLGEFSLGAWFVPLAVVVIVGSSNAVNLTDGLDGLAGGCLILATGAMAVLVFAGGHAGLAEYLHVARIPQAGEMLVVAGGMTGGVLGFLWFNCHPAQVFMGDTGSLPLGGLLGLLAVIARQELLLAIVGGVFVAEAASVLLQIGWYRSTGRRLFRCAPLHHHFEFEGWPETQIVVRFWIASALCALVGLASVRFMAMAQG